jgi:solute carrier family 35 protein F1/2
VASQALANQGVHAPTTQAFLNYCLLAAVYGTSSLLVPALAHVRLQRRRALTTSKQQPSSADADHDAATAAHAAKWARLARSWPSFAALAFIDVEANVLVTKAYQYTSLTSCTLLDCFTIPAVMALSWVVLRARYRPGHFGGAAACVAGLTVLVLGDSAGTGGGSSAGSAPLLGDALVLAGALLYAVCNVSQELLLGDVEPGELLALLGLFGALLSGLQAAALERSSLALVAGGSPSVLLPLAGFVAAMFAFYSLVPQVLQLGGATVLNLGLLSSDGFAALARAAWFGGFQGWTAHIFVASLVLVAAGLLVFTLSGSPRAGEQEHGQQPGSSQQGDGRALDAASAARAAAPGAGVGYSRLGTSDVEAPGVAAPSSS